MKDSERRRYEMLVRVRDFGLSHAVSFPEGTLGHQLFNTLNEIVAELDAHAVAQSSGASTARQGTTSRGLARAALREALEAISRTARAMSFDNPGLEDKFRMPPANSNDQELLNAARACAVSAAPLSAEFIRHEMPTQFLADLNSDIEEFEEAVNNQNKGVETRVSATAALNRGIERGVEIVRRLDAVVRNKFRDDRAMLAAWTSASHTERATRSSAPPAQNQTPNP